jgi:glycerol-3-phosphate acyltransferase PlsY
MLFMAILLMLLLAYLFGSIPFGYLIARIWNIDIRKYGSGNIGATNVIRVLGPLPGSLVLLLDLLKGTAAVYLTSIATSHPDIIIVGGLLAVLGHMFSIFLKLKGGKVPPLALECFWESPQRFSWARLSAQSS